MCTAGQTCYRSQPEACFNSLQTGKHMCTRPTHSHCTVSRHDVSIPFKRESTCALRGQRNTNQNLDAVLFQFPSNGKAHVHEQRLVDTLLMFGFNSLQTGKHMCTITRRKTVNHLLIRVSIPFKRESTCARGEQYTFRRPKPFQFPSNGKAHVHALESYLLDPYTPRVSIPFKRESTCARGEVEYDPDISGDVSIPFKRESTCARLKLIKMLGQERFQFPSNGKAHVHGMVFLIIGCERFSFQFPSNGKAHVHDTEKPVVK